MLTAESELRFLQHRKQYTLTSRMCKQLIDKKGSYSLETVSQISKDDPYDGVIATVLNKLF